MLLLLLLLVFGTIIFYSFNTSSLWEGLETINDTKEAKEAKEYVPYNTSDPNNCLILAQQNAGNIEVLKEQIQDIRNVKPQMDRMAENIDAMQIQMQQLVQQQADYAQELAGSSPPYITGMTEDDANDDL